MNKKPFVLLVHGYNVTSQFAWYGLLLSKLRDAELEAVAPDFPGGRYPTPGAWLRLIHYFVQQHRDQPVVLVGHSLGTRAILLYLERFKPALAGIVLVAPCPNTLSFGKRHNGAESPFFTSVLPTRELQRLSPRRMIIHSQDDSIIPYIHGVGLARELDATLISLNGFGHFQDPRAGATIAQHVIEVSRGPS